MAHEKTFLPLVGIGVRLVYGKETEGVFGLSPNWPNQNFGMTKTRA
jgi:hypothetical protein